MCPKFTYKVSLNSMFKTSCANKLFKTIFNIGPKFYIPNGRKFPVKQGNRNFHVNSTSTKFYNILCNSIRRLVITNCSILYLIQGQNSKFKRAKFQEK